MDYGDYYWGLHGDYYRDPFPHSLLGTMHPKRADYSLFAKGSEIGCGA